MEGPPVANLVNPRLALFMLLGASPLALAQSNPALADCLQSATNQTCENPEGTTLTGNNGIYDAGTLTLTNNGSLMHWKLWGFRALWRGYNQQR